MAEGFVSDLFVRDGAAAWSQSRCVRGCGLAAYETVSLTRFLTRRRGARAKELARAELTAIAGGSNSVVQDVSYAASASHAVEVEQSQGTSGDEYFEFSGVFAGPIGSPLPRLFNCRAYDIGFALDASRLAFVARGCPPKGRRIVVRDLAGGPGSAVQTGELGVAEVALEGDFLAAAGYEEPGLKIAAWNWRTGAEVASVALPSRPTVPVPAIAADGSLAYVSRRGACAGTLNVIRPGEAAPSVLATGVCGNPYWVGEELATERSDRLVAVAPGGGERTLLSLGAVRLEAFAADAADLAYILPTCAGSQAVHLVGTGAPAGSAGAPGCPLAIPPQRLSAGPRRRVRVRLRCARGCFGVAGVRARGRRVANAFYSRGAGRGEVALKLPRAFTRRLEERGSLRVTVTADTLDRSGRTLERRRQLRLSAG